MGIDTHHYQSTLMVQEFLGPIEYDLIIRIDDDSLYSTYVWFDVGKPAGACVQGKPLPVTAVRSFQRLIYHTAFLIIINVHCALLS